MTEQSVDFTKIASALEVANYEHNEKVMFPNGYGVSIIRNQYSYGGRNGKFEVAVLDSEGELCYDTAVTGDVLGYLSVVDVMSTMRAVAALPPANSPEAALNRLRAKRDEVQAVRDAKRLEVEKLTKQSADLTAEIRELEGL